MLEELFETSKATLPTGEKRNLTANISAESAWALYGVTLRERPPLAIEVGMANGVSTLAILTALAQTGGKLISIDPYNGWKSAKAAALYAIERAGFNELHEHVEAPSYEALPLLFKEGRRPGLAYIDGAHDFANVFIDAFYADKLLDLEGILGFNDAGWPTVYRVIRFLRRLQRYEEVDVGLRRRYTGRDVFHTSARILLRRSREDRYFRKRRDSAPT